MNDTDYYHRVSFNTTEAADQVDDQTDDGQEEINTHLLLRHLLTSFEEAERNVCYDEGGYKTPFSVFMFYFDICECTSGYLRGHLHLHGTGNDGHRSGI